VPAAAISAALAGRNTTRRRQQVEELLLSLVATGAARSAVTEIGETRIFTPRPGG
jgi:hypothetical protein